MDQAQFLHDRHDERKRLFDGLFNRKRKVQALEDANRALKLENAVLNEELQKKDLVVQNLCEFLNEQGDPADQQA